MPTRRPAASARALLRGVLVGLLVLGPVALGAGVAGVPAAQALPALPSSSPEPEPEPEPGEPEPAEPAPEPSPSPEPAPPRTPAPARPATPAPDGPAPRQPDRQEPAPLPSPDRAPSVRETPSPAPTPAPSRTASTAASPGPLLTGFIPPAPDTAVPQPPREEPEPASAPPGGDDPITRGLRYGVVAGVLLGLAGGTGLYLTREHR